MQAECKRKLRAKHEEIGNAKSQVKAAKAEIRKLKKAHGEQYFRTAKAAATAQTEFERELVVKYQEIASLVSQRNKERKADDAVIYAQDVKIADLEEGAVEIGKAANAEIHAKGLKISRLILLSDAKVQEIAFLKSECEERLKAADAVIYAQDVQIINLEEGAVEMGKAANAEIHAKGLKISRLISQSDAQAQEIVTLRSECEERLKAADAVIYAQDVNNSDLRVAIS